LSTHITQIASDLIENVENKYALILEVAEIAKRLLEEQRIQAEDDYFGTTYVGTSVEKVIYQSLMMKASEEDVDNGLIG
jgi:hypothetical protein